MAEAATIMPTAAEGHPATQKVVIKRHSLLVRICHWVNALSLLFLLLSGLQIFNAEPNLFWGQKADFIHPVLGLNATMTPNGALHGDTSVLGAHFNTTGFLGASKAADGELVARGFPSWLTIPTGRDLATGRRWHFFFAWLFAINGATLAVYAFASGHFRRDLAPKPGELKTIPAAILSHLKFQFGHGPEARNYNILQKLSYIIVLFVLLPLMVLTGLTMSPGGDAVFPILPWIFLGRQSARTLHFLVAWSLVGFFLIHIFMVFAAGFFNEMRSIITGKFAIEVPVETPAPISTLAPTPIAATSAEGASS